MFQGILDGKPNCNTKPLVTEVNAYEKNKAYFDDFFSDKGIYLNFIDADKSEKMLSLYLQQIKPLLES
ncbi:hypothetical protein BXU10_17810 [Flavobacterium sp. LM4]|nr:hypothetical protein BXU10_17810 [Flavobacterium sp. LM4]